MWRRVTRGNTRCACGIPTAVRSVLDISFANVGGFKFPRQSVCWIPTAVSLLNSHGSEFVEFPRQCVCWIPTVVCLLNSHGSVFMEFPGQCVCVDIPTAVCLWNSLGSVCVCRYSHGSVFVEFPRQCVYGIPWAVCVCRYSHGSAECGLWGMGRGRRWEEESGVGISNFKISTIVLWFTPTAVYVCMCVCVCDIPTAVWVLEL